MTNSSGPPKPPLKTWVDDYRPGDELSDEKLREYVLRGTECGAQPEHLALIYDVPVERIRALLGKPTRH